MSIAKSSFRFASGTLLSRISGLVRDSVFVGVFGASALHDAFLIAFRIPNLLREMFAEGALGSSFTKVFASRWQENPILAKTLAVDAIYVSGLLSTAVCLLGITFSPELVRLMTLRGGQAYDSNFMLNTIGLTRLLFPYLGLTMIGSIVMGIMHQQGKFFISAVSPIAFNLGNIAGALALAPAMRFWAPAWLAESFEDPGIIGLGLGVLVGGILQLVWQLQTVMRTVIWGSYPKLWPFPLSPDLSKVFVVMIPAALAASTGPINIFVNTNFASSLGPGAVTWLNYAFRLLQLPIGIFSVAVSSAVLPRLAKSLHGLKSGEVSDDARNEFQGAVELVLWLITPCMVALYALHLPIIKLLFEHGKFTAYDSVQTAGALQAYSFGMIGYGLTKVITTFYYAVERTSFALKVALLCMGINYIANELLVQSLGHIGLAVTSSIVLSANAGILLFGLRRYALISHHAERARSAFLLIGACGTALLVQSLCAPLRAALQLAAPGKVGSLAEIILGGLIIFTIFSVAGLWLLRTHPRQVIAQARKKFRPKAGTRTKL